MYTPGSFRIDEPEFIREIVREHPFAMLVSSGEGEPVATHLPFLLVQEGDRDVLVAHMAKANPQWQSFGGRVLVIFAGPHGYVSPSWYKTWPNVPTWNYVAVHAYGTPEIVEGEAALDHLRKLVDAFDPELGRTNPESLDREYHRKMLGGIVAFRIPVERWEGKAKLNQNKLGADRVSVRHHYQQSAHPDERAMAALMARSSPE